ncbi:uncharacterized protein [Paramisgurnus dabryanus]|uniref:uncharacterized protein n=1 Tax=Paramisgurnus dabryanus TaxID=90735 RepID=UPI003CCF4870
MPEPDTSPQFLTANKHTYSRLNKTTGKTSSKMLNWSKTVEQWSEHMIGPFKSCRLMGFESDLDLNQSLFCRTAWLNGKKRDPKNNGTERFFITAVEEPEPNDSVCDGHNNSSEVHTAEDKETWPMEDREPSQGSLDSNSTSTSFNTGSSVDNESSCSVCEDQTGNEIGSPGRNILDTPPSGCLLCYQHLRILLRDPMLGAFPTAWKKRLLIRTMLPETPTQPRHPSVRTADNLILSPSLLSSPSQGLNHFLLPEGQETLQALFEDVWVTPESTNLKSPRMLCRTAEKITPLYIILRDIEIFIFSEPPIYGNFSIFYKQKTPFTHVKSAGSGCLSSETEKGDKVSEDEISTPEHFVPLKKERKASGQRRTAGKRRIQTEDPSSKKKCVNGFIMFCRMNRKAYIRSHPGTASTTVTKELAHLWHVMPKQERRLYCLKAWRFSCQNNRNVRIVTQDEETEADDPSPLHRLLAQKDTYCAIKRRSLHFI